MLPKEAKELEALRNFRDSVLNQTPEGQELIHLYYQWSPMIIELMSNDREFREDVKELMDGLRRAADDMGMQPNEAGDYVLPDDIKTLAPFALAHRLIVRPESQLRGRTAESILAQILEQTELDLDPAGGQNTVG